ncbi:MAG: hypothetical protein ACREGD_02400 [Candidatus Saccharimonadales bacterium]
MVISGKDDAHIEFVQRHLSAPMILIDSLGIVKDETPLTYRWSKKSLNFCVELGGKPINAKSVWYRKPQPIFAKDISHEQGPTDYAVSASQTFNWLLRTQFESALWISDYFAMYRAENKLLQLSLARRLGFNVPDTICTSSKLAASEFLYLHRTIIFKPIKIVFFKEDGLYKGLFARKLHQGATTFDHLYLAPAIFQQLIEPDFDVRVTVVGNKTFSAAIRSGALEKENSMVRDWRFTETDNSIHFEMFDLPPQIAKLCVTHVKQLGLEFGALDLVLDKKGKFWFLENNPNGQWAFVEEEAGLPIGKAIAETLAK